MNQEKYNEAIEYFTEMMMDKKDEKIELQNRLTLDLHQSLIGVLFRFVNIYAVKFCKEENKESVKKLITLFPQHTIDHWQKKMFDKIDSELNEFKKHKENSSISKFACAMMGKIDFEKQAKEKKVTVKEVADCYREITKYVEAVKNDRSAEEERRNNKHSK